jgi:hypothetical protein
MRHAELPRGGACCYRREETISMNIFAASSRA